MVELTVPYESRMEEAHAFKEGKYMDLTKELKKDGYEARVMPVEIGARGFVGSSAYGLLSKLSIGGNKRTKALRLLAETAENISRWIWSRRNERTSVRSQAFSLSSGQGGARTCNRRFPADLRHSAFPQDRVKLEPVTEGSLQISSLQPFLRPGRD
ncbi:reverse transcriptase [Plakobranchus ocellatus]|uniref:Reverse transcriptase n=1 Tax=Plakobranchus ocellatus TaxID=259542 RepID=A0AAV4AX39_9GAST|nr:reverse transcriptase [Plakobranchus ocellatus]